MLSVIASVARDATFASTICINTLFGPVYLFRNSLAANIYLYLLVGTSTTATIVLSAAVVVKICRMKRSAISAHQHETNRVALYILSISLLFFTCLTAVFLGGSLDALTDNVPFYIKIVLPFLFALYGIFNTLLYVFLNRKYSRMLHEVVCAFLRPRMVSDNSVVPSS